MRKIINSLLLLLCAHGVYGQSQLVSLKEGPDGYKLTVDNKEVIINGVNRDYFPIGTNFSFSLWQQSDDVIYTILHTHFNWYINIRHIED